MGQAYNNALASRQVDVANLGPVALLQAAPSASAETCIGNAKIYAVNASEYTIKSVLKISGASPAADAKVRALVNGTLAKEITYTTDGLKDDFEFQAPAGATIKFEYSSNIAAAGQVDIKPHRIQVLAGGLKECSC